MFIYNFLYVIILLLNYFRGACVITFTIKDVKLLKNLKS